MQKLYILRVALGLVAALLCIVYGVASGSINKNLIPDPSAEAGAATPDYWIPSLNGTEWSTNYARTGSRSIRINVDNASAEWKSQGITIQEGYAYQVSGFFTGEVTKDQFLLTVRWFSDSGGVDLLPVEDNISIPVNSYKVWSPLGNVFTAPTGAKSCRIAFIAVNGTGDMYGDDFQVRQTEVLVELLNGAVLAMIVYIGSYYLIKYKLASRVEKPQKLFTMGIGVYFLSWIFFWILLYTIIAGA